MPTILSPRHRPPLPECTSGSRNLGGLNFGPLGCGRDWRALLTPPFIQPALGTLPGKLRNHFLVSYRGLLVRPSHDRLSILCRFLVSASTLILNFRSSETPVGFKFATTCCLICLTTAVASCHTSSLSFATAMSAFESSLFISPQTFALESLSLIRERLLLVVPESVRYGRRDNLSTLCDTPFVLISRSASATFHHHAVSVCRCAGFTPHVVQEASETFTILNFVRAGETTPPRLGAERFFFFSRHSAQLIERALTICEWSSSGVLLVSSR